MGDPVAGRKLITWAKQYGVKLNEPPYTHPRAFTVSPDKDAIAKLQRLLSYTWGSGQLTVLDPCSGGGSIPFEALRYGFTTIANEFNPVAVVILLATLQYPAQFGTPLAADVKRYGRVICDQVRERLLPFFPIPDDREQVYAYLWARTVRCPYTGKLIPLSPNWWLQKGANPVAVRPVFDLGAEAARFEIVTGKGACERARPDLGTVRRGDAISPWAGNQPVDGEYIKAEAQAGRMGQQLYAIAVKKRGGFAFRAPTAEDLAAVAAAEAELARRLPVWEAKGWVPREPYPEVSNDLRPLHYGMATWADLFSPRQLLSLCTFVEVFQEVKARVFHELPEDRARAVVTYLAFAGDKAVDYNSRLMRWDGTRNKLANTFDRHDFSFKWSHGEFDASRNLFPWTLDQVLDAYQGIARLVEREATLEGRRAAVPVTVRQGSAADLDGIPSGSVDHICVDPPYYANVMYAELSDFFYVWMKRTLGDVYPKLFAEELTNKDDEAVANEARFKAMGRKSKALAHADYERKMAAAFREMHRVLRDDGVLTVMFTHKEAKAWDTLGSALMTAGFAIHASWPVHTESEHSLHQAKKNAAASTILLTCRKRAPSAEPAWWEDLKGLVRRTAREKAQEFQQQGISGVDLYIATFGPTLAIISERWPVLTSEVDGETGEPKPLRPEVALDLAREEVVALRKQGLLLGHAVRFDPVTDWYLLAWDAFKAEEFPADEARKLALALDLDLEQVLVREKRLLAKQGSTVVLQQPAARRRRGMVDPELGEFTCMIDAAHTAMLVYGEEGARACEAFLRRAGLREDATFKACLQALLNAVPRVKQKGAFVRPEAAVLDQLRLAFFDDLAVPNEEAPPEPVQQALFTAPGERYGEDGEELP